MRFTDILGSCVVLASQLAEWASLKLTLVFSAGRKLNRIACDFKLLKIFAAIGLLDANATTT